MMEGRPYRLWCGRFQWPGKAIFRAGTVQVLCPKDAAHHEIEKAVMAEFDKFWRDILPDNVPRPASIALIPGAIHFVPEEKP